MSVLPQRFDTAHNQAINQSHDPTITTPTPVRRLCGRRVLLPLSSTCAPSHGSGELQSYLIEITGQILNKQDDVSGSGHVVDKILDKTGMKGTGRWTVQEAAERSVPCSTITAALDMRYLSARKDERVHASTVLTGPAEVPSVDKSQLLDDAKSALYAAKICSYAQGMELIKAASREFEWNVDLGECARIWKGGCIIRAAFLDRIKAA